jgi:hypothetical protein
MWEAKAADGRAAELLAWVVEHAHPAAEVYRSGDGRVVVIDATDTALPDPPSDFVARPPHAWHFTPVER